MTDYANKDCSFPSGDLGKQDKTFPPTGQTFFGESGVVGTYDWTQRAIDHVGALGMTLPPSKYALAEMDRPIDRREEAIRDDTGADRPDYAAP